METEIKVGLFVSIGLLLTMVAISTLGSVENFMSRANKYYVHFEKVEGLVIGAKVVLNGLNVGTVEDLDFDNKNKDIFIQIQVAKRYEDWIRKDSSVEILTQGVLGDKYISIQAGSADQPVLPKGSTLVVRPTKDLEQFLSKGDKLLVSLNSISGSLDHLLKQFDKGNRGEDFFSGISETAKNMSQASRKLNIELDQLGLKKAVRNLDGVLEKINNGTGTLGALVNDPGLYYDAKALLGSANRNRMIRNFVRQTVKSSEEEQSK